jgi:hypothetical protein
VSAPRDWRSGRVADVLWIAAAVLTIVAVIARLWPVRPDGRELPTFADTAPAAMRAATPAPSLDSVVATNVFSAHRAPPRRRWVPPAPDTLPPGLAPDPIAAADLRATAPTGDGPPRFYGTVIDPRGAAALLWLDPAVPGAQLYREGARAAGWRVMHIDAERVQLGAAGGQRVTLRLTRDTRTTAAPPPSDSSGS